MGRKFDLQMILGAKDKASKKLSKVKVAVLAISAAAVAAAIKLTSMAIKAASDFEETNSKFQVVFSSISNEAESMATNLTKNFGLSSLSAKRLLSDTGDLLTGFGFTQEAALDLANESNKLAVDLASFTNFAGGAEGASAALTKAMLGETEAAKQLGIVIKSDSDEYKELFKHYVEVEGASENQAKAMTALKIATNQSKNAIGDFARTNQSFANQSRILKAKLEDIAVAFGTALLPAATDVVKMFVKGATAVSKFSEGLKELQTEASTFGVAQKEANSAVQVASKLITAQIRLIWGSVAALVGQGKMSLDTYTKMIDDVNSFTEAFVGAEDEKAAAVEITNGRILASSLDLTAQEIAQQKRLKDIFDKNRADLLIAEQKKMQKLIQMSNKIADTWSDDLGQMISGSIAFNEGLKGIFTSLKNHFINQVAEMAARWATFQALKGIGTILTGGIFGGIGKLLGFANGGIIPEPVAGVGLLTGRGYSFAERGPERVLSNSDSFGNNSSSGINLKVIVTGNTIMGDRGINTFSERVSNDILNKVKMERNI